MRTTSRTLLALGTVLSAACASEQAETAEAPADPNPLDGAWRVIEATTTGPNGSTNANPQPGLRLIVDGHYSLITVNSAEPRPVLPADATPAQRAANLQAITAQAGLQEVEGDLVTTRPFVAKNPGVMDAGSFTRLRYQLLGDTLTMTQVEGDAGPIENPTTTKYLRVGSADVRGPLDGAWRTVEITTTGPEATTNSNPLPGLRLVVGGYYSQLQLTRDRPAQFSENPTPEEEIEIWGALTANTGTIEVAGETVRTRPQAAMSAGVMAADRPAAVRTFRMQGDTLWLTQVETAGEPIANPTTEKLVRAR